MVCIQIIRRKEKDEETQDVLQPRGDAGSSDRNCSWGI